MVELISNYTQNSLKESFAGNISHLSAGQVSWFFSLGLDMTLKFQFRDLSLARACYDFIPGAQYIKHFLQTKQNKLFKDQSESNMLTFKSGDVLAVIDTMGDTGWWKAIKDNRIGYIPKDFVTSF